LDGLEKPHLGLHLRSQLREGDGWVVAIELEGLVGSLHPLGHPGCLLLSSRSADDDPRQACLACFDQVTLLTQRVDTEALVADAEARGWGEEAARHRRLIERLDRLISDAQSA
jgi:hypothetical protein